MSKYEEALTRWQQRRYIQYRVAAQPAIQRCAPWLPELATEGYTLPPGEALQRLVVEINSGTIKRRP